MALTITAFPDIKYVLGQSGRLQSYMLSPGTSDYPTSGYPITAAQLELGQLVGATITGTNAAGAVYTAKPVFPASSFTPLPPDPATVINLVVTVADVQVTANTNLAGVNWFCDILGW